MLDSCCYARYQRLLTAPVIPYLAACQWLRPSYISCLACLFGLLLIPLLAANCSYFAVIALLISGYLDTLDGALARATGRSSAKGAVLDIVCDRIVEFSVVMGLFLFQPDRRALLCLLMLGSMMICITSFLVVSLFLSDDGNDIDGKKSFYYSAGLIERTESFIFFALMIMLPTFFMPLALLFMLLVLLTALLRMLWFFYWR